MKTQPQYDSNESKPDSAVQFDPIAFLYDELMSGVPYREWVAYLGKLLKRHECHPETVLDVCCGTGSVSLLLAQKSMQVTGIDISHGMIECARRRAEEAGLPIDFHVQDAAKLRIPGRFNLAVSFFDSLNYILESSVLQQVFYRVAERMEANGLFIFDMNTELAFSTGLFNQSNLGSMKAPVIYNWRSSYDSASKICRVHMDFVSRMNGDEKHIEVIHYQRAYSEQEIAEMLTAAGFTVEAAYNAYTFRKPSLQSDRVFFVARK
jgi:ubiquinone/menaquinone biosynthesis C-methylase UbiE